MSGFQPPLDDAVRDAIIADIRETAGTTDGSVRRIAARHHVGMGTVRRTATAAGLADAWRDGAHLTEAANAQKAAHLAERRNQLQADLLDDAEELRERLLGHVTQLHVVKDEGPMAGERIEHTTLPAGPRDWASTMQAIAAAARVSIDLARLEAENSGTGAASGLLDQFEQSLRTARHKRDQAEQASE
ncbi:hypothetical protein [Actinokineospora globicatena]|uniref:Uncharacterized protein n=1 Tax=Actinokineospora globicatena TaxID=103729 RepID=A0A9W6QNI2_9PSEU|nr:hypothetical protein [Actinokineospora globicatena]GLW91792.1 hypothetical protein Aglo03_26080 [Actinokineospora globicatena]